MTENFEGRNESGSIATIIDERLPALDDFLAKSRVAITERPLRATFEFIELWILELNDPGVGRFQPTFSSDDAAERWFAALYQPIEKWYRRRYRDSFKSETPDNLVGFVLIWSTAFSMLVPRRVTFPDVPGKTIWLQIPGEVLPNEKPPTWLVSPPDLKQLSEVEHQGLHAAICAVANRLRSINVSLLGVPRPDEISRGLLSAILGHLERAAAKAVSAKHPELETGCWDLHLAAECSLKSAVYKSTNQVYRTHDLEALSKAAASQLPALPIQAVRSLPSWKDAVQYRYGRGTPVSLETYWGFYLAALEIVDTTLAPLATFKLGNAQFKIGRPPWKKPLT